MPSRAPKKYGTTSSGKVRASRAQQFMPFAALRGYYDLVAQQERVIEPRKEHTEEDIARLSALLSQVRKGSVVQVRHYEDGAYVITCGAVSEIIPEYQTLRVIKKRISFEDIYDLQLL